MNSNNSRTNEFKKFLYEFTDKLNFKNPNKNMALANLKTLNLYITTIDLKYVFQLGMMSLICLMDHILFQTFKIIWNMPSKNMKL